MKQLYISTLLVLFSLVASAQSTDWQTKEDYLRDTAQVAQTIRWLEQNPFPEPFSERQQKAQYAFKWIEGAPYTVNIDATFLQPILEDKKFAYKDMMVPQFVFGKGLYLIQHNGDKNEYEANLRGVQSMVTLYKHIKATDKRAKNKLLEKMEAAADQDKLPAYVRSQMK
ncbi:hypothetical protein I2I11_18490 [Pontibacter sp. 172403-2]|uniref:hypothetical protein n=1 Tax=Pontibacter rufus TaxID=2791028 RepID=UPI0018AF9B30|nr:hypothetical protein [Pontibacter sp. 172403-2]MBF9255293.1 hypothetical protein [Pontibacter sp. 172403-2]